MCLPKGRCGNLFKGEEGVYRYQRGGDLIKWGGGRFFVPIKGEEVGFVYFGCAGVSGYITNCQ